MVTPAPQYYEVRLNISEMDDLFAEYVGCISAIDVGETLRVMLADYFYGEQLAPNGNAYTQQNRTLVLQHGAELSNQDIDNAITALGDIFWVLADTITNRALQVSMTYTHRPNECFYNFFPATRELVIYTPVMTDRIHNSLRVPLDGFAVMVVCKNTLPSLLRGTVPSLLQNVMT